MTAPGSTGPTATPGQRTPREYADGARRALQPGLVPRPADALRRHRGDRAPARRRARRRGRRRDAVRVRRLGDEGRARLGVRRGPERVHRAQLLGAPAPAAFPPASRRVRSRPRPLGPARPHGFGVDLAQQARRQQPLHGPIRRRAGRGVAGPAHRRALRQPPQQIALRVVDDSEPVGDLGAGVLGAFEDRLARIPGQACRGLGGHPDLGVAPHQRPFAQVVDGGGQASSPTRSPISAVSLVSGTGVVSACSVSSASSTASRRKSSSSVAALTDCLDCARAASAAMLPGGGWVRSGRSSSSRISRSSGKSASQAPNGAPGLCSDITDQRKAARRSRHRPRRLPQYGRGREEAEDPLCRQRLADDRTATTITRSASWPPTAPARSRPFGDLTFPLPSEDLPYTHPVTVVNR